MNFQHLNVDKRTFHILLLYIDYLSNHGRSCFELDNLVQVAEMEKYLESSEGSSKELLLQWIKKHGGDFRAYLNSIKIAALILISQGINQDSLSFEKFSQTCCQLNLQKEHCLDSLF